MPTRTRSIARVAAVWMLAAAAVAAPTALQPTWAGADPGPSLRAQYHLTPPGAWLSDPQRPVYANGKYNLYYLFSNDSNTGQGGWEHATSTDNVVFTDAGTAIPYAPNFPVWTGSAVVDNDDTAGFGAGAVVALATQPTDGDRFRQEQYLWYSTDGGNHFTAYGAPVIANPDPGHDDWFRDPKISWDPDRSRWVAVVGEDHALAFFTSPDLKTWTHQSEWSYPVPDIGGFECPDLFQITADDGSTHWVLAGSFQGDRNGLPDTYGYWTGSWDGQNFTADTGAPQWLDWGWDWYAAVTWPDQASPATSRFATAWMDNWRYASLTQSPTYASDGYTGQLSVTRKISLGRQDDGSYSLRSQPVPSLDDHVTATIRPADVTVDGSLDLDYHGSAYELDADVSWQQLTNVGISLGMSGDRSRYTNVGVWQGDRLYVDRARTDQPGQNPDVSFGPYQHAEAPYGPTNSVHLRIFVDRSSVEVYTGDGRRALSSLAYFRPGDTGISLYTDGGPARFSNLTIKEYSLA